MNRTRAIPTRICGSLVAFESGETTSYALFYIQERGELFVGPGVQVYSGMIVGRSSRPGDIDVNVCKKKHLTSIRNAAGAEEALKITNLRELTLEEAMEFITDDELVEITPKSLECVNANCPPPTARRCWRIRTQIDAVCGHPRAMLRVARLHSRDGYAPVLRIW